MSDVAILCTIAIHGKHRCLEIIDSALFADA